MDPKYARQAACLNRGPLGRLCLELLGQLHVEMCDRGGPAALHLAVIADSFSEAPTHRLLRCPPKAVPGEPSRKKECN